MRFRRREEIEAKEGRDIARLATRGAGSLLYSGMIVGAVLLVLVISIRLEYQLDVTARNDNKLSPQTEALLDSLEEPVKLYALYPKTDPDAREAYWTLLRKYRQSGSKLEVEFVDPVARPGIFKQLGLTPEQAGVGRGNVTVAVRGDRKVTFQGNDEESVTNAILEVGRTERRVVGFVRGYGEKNPMSSSSAGYAAASAALSQEYYEVVDVALVDGVPPEVDVLIAAGPRLQIPERDLDVLAAWLETGGRLLALLDPDDPSGLNRVLRRWGLQNLGEPILDVRQNLNNSQDFIRVADYSKHEIVRGFGANLPLAFPVAGAVAHFEPGDPLVFHDDLAFSSDFSFAVTGDGSRRTGAQSVAAASWRTEPLAGGDVVTRLVLIGDSDFATNQYLPAAANRNMWLNCVGWLSRQTELISVRRQPLQGQRFELGSSDNLPLWFAVFGAPLLVFLAGVAMFVRRRSM